VKGEKEEKNSQKRKFNPYVKVAHVLGYSIVKEFYFVALLKVKKEKSKWKSQFLTYAVLEVYIIIIILYYCIRPLNAIIIR